MPKNNAPILPDPEYITNKGCAFWMLIIGAIIAATVWYQATHPDADMPQPAPSTSVVQTP